MTISIFAEHPLSATAAVLAILIGACVLRDPFLRLGWKAARAPCVVVLMTAAAAEALVKRVPARVDGAMGALRTIQGTNSDTWPGLLALMPLIYLTLAIVLDVADWVLFDLRVAPFMGLRTNVADWTIPVHLLVSTIVLASLVVYALVTVELHDLMPAGGPWRRAQREWRQGWLFRLCIYAAAALTVGSLALAIWGAVQNADESLPTEVDLLVRVVFWSCVVVPVLGASVLATAGAVPAVLLVFWLLVLVVCEGLSRACAFALPGVARVIALLFDVLVAIYDLPAGIGKGVVNVGLVRLSPRYGVCFLTYPPVDQPLGTPDPPWGT